MTHPIHETPKERLTRVAGYGPPHRRMVSRPSYLVGVALLVLILTLLIVAIMAGSGAGEMFRAYSQWIGG